MAKKTNPNPRANKNVLGVTYLMVAVFLGLAVYLGYFLQAGSEDVIDNSYNARLDSLSDRIVKGRVLAVDGTVLAQTQVNGEGNETRVYDLGSVFDRVVDYSTRRETGIEAIASFYLLTPYVNLAEQVVDELAGHKNLGDSVYTTLDAQPQQATYAALGDRKDVVIVTESDTGKVLAMISKPGYDPNTLLQDWDVLTSGENREGQLLNHAVQGLYPPGSTLKIVTALEYMREYPDNYRDYQSDYRDVYENGDYRIKYYYGTAHGYQDFTPAFISSCNDAFSSLGLDLNLGEFRETARSLLFDSPLPMTGMSYKQNSFQTGPGAGAWEILQMPIGQGAAQITPLYSAMITVPIANGGTLMKPYFLSSVESAGGKEIKRFMLSAYGSLMIAGEAAGLAELMRVVVIEGTGSGVRTDAYTVAAKTGSTESETGKETHAWFTGFAPTESPRLMVTVLVEEGGSGGRVVAPIARQLFNIYVSR